MQKSDKKGYALTALMNEQDGALREQCSEGPEPACLL